MASPWNALNQPDPPIPTMVSREERRYLYWLCKDEWDGSSSVLEFGPWLGNTTYMLAAGMKANANRDDTARLYTVDNFKWRPFMNGRAPLQLPPDASFRSHFERNLVDHNDILTVLEAQLPDDTVGDIEFPDPIRSHDQNIPVFTRSMVDAPLGIVFIDGAKSWKALAHLFQETLSICPPGALVVFQDFKNWGSYWVPMAVALASQSFVIAHVLPVNTVAFRYTARTPEIPQSIDDITVPAGLRLIDDAERLLAESGDPDGARIVALSAVAFFAAKDEWDFARKRFCESERRWRVSMPLRDLERVREWLIDRTGSPLPPTARTRSLSLMWRGRRKAQRSRRALTRKLRS